LKRVTGWGGRLARRWWPDHNPLRRRWDRVEAAIVAGLITVFLAGAPVAALAASNWAHGVAQRVQQQQRAGWQRIPAVLARSAGRADDSGFAGDALAQVPAHWTAPDGTPRAGQVMAEPGSKAGSRILIWVNSSGRPTGQPLADHQVAEQALLAAVVTVGLLAMVLAAAGALARRLLDARRLAAWDEEWRVTGPRWSTHR
jgi:hypothetical protein